VTDDKTPVTGPALVVTTRYLRRGPRRVALRTRAITIPGTFQLSKVLGACIGALLCLALSAGPAMALGMWQLAIIVAVFGALGGVLVTSWSPLKGESFMRWLVLWSAHRMGLVKIGGRYVRAYVGTTAVQRAPFGMSQMVRSYVEAEPTPTNTPPLFPVLPVVDASRVPLPPPPVVPHVPSPGAPGTGAVMGRTVVLTPPNAAAVPAGAASRAS
jgi:hypothetical protein